MSLLSAAGLISKFNYLIAQAALCSSSTGKWHNFPYSRWKGVVPKRVLNAVRYAQSALSNFLDQSFRDVPTVFSKISLICRFEISTCPLVCGWYGVATLWCTPFFRSSPSKFLLMKWDPPSLMTIRGIPNLGKIMLLKSLITTDASFVREATASTHFDT